MKLTIILLLCSLITPPATHGVADGPIAVESWFKALPHSKEKVTKLHFFFHDTLSGKNPTSVRVAQANTTFRSPTFFGLVNMVDDPLTVGPEPDSGIIGRAQGFYGSAGMEQLGLLMAMDFVFTAGKHKGSTLTVLGRNPAFDLYREMPIVGGSGVFRLARGVATARTHWFDIKTGDAVVEYHVVVVHY